VDGYEKEKPMKTLLKRALLVVAPILWKKYRDRRAKK
jgi:hypothetical protein